MNILGKIFKFLTDLLNGSERYIVDFISTFVPYAVPVIPAYLTYHNTMLEMDFPQWVAWTAAFVVEALGLASVATAVRFWRHNVRYKSEANRAPFKLAVAVYVFYIVVVILVNVILEIVAGNRGGWVILSIALFSMLSFPASVLISIRYMYSEMLVERAEKNASRRGEHLPAENDGGGARGRRTKHASSYREQIVTMLNDEYRRSGKILQPKEITSALKLDHDRSKGFVSTLTSQWKKENNIMGF
jgi:hypothetical protein